MLLQLGTAWGTVWLLSSLIPEKEKALSEKVSEQPQQQFDKAKNHDISSKYSDRKNINSSGSKHLLQGVDAPIEKLTIASILERVTSVANSVNVAAVGVEKSAEKLTNYIENENARIAANRDLFIQINRLVFSVECVLKSAKHSCEIERQLDSNPSLKEGYYKALANLRSKTNNKKEAKIELHILHFPPVLPGEISDIVAEERIKKLKKACDILAQTLSHVNSDRMLEREADKIASSSFKEFLLIQEMLLSDYILGIINRNSVSIINDDKAQKDLKKSIVLPNDFSDNNGSFENSKENNGSDLRVYFDKKSKNKFIDLDHFVSSEGVSTSNLGRIVGLKAKPFIFDKLIKDGYITRSDSRYDLTDLGKHVDVGGSYRDLSDGNRAVVWPIKFGDFLLPIKENFLDRSNFRLFHMTHMSNLKSIMNFGLSSHNSAPEYLDISNPTVNSRRERVDPVHKKSLHDYVPMYFNPRNAMLYEKQREHPDKIVIIEVDRRVCLSNYTIYSEGNAAANRSRIVYCLSDVTNFDWSNINSDRWTIDGVVNVDTKQLMMSECLVLNSVDSEYLISIHVKNSDMMDSVVSTIGYGNNAIIKLSPTLFF